MSLIRLPITFLLRDSGTLELLNSLEYPYNVLSGEDVVVLPTPSSETGKLRLEIATSAGTRAVAYIDRPHDSGEIE